MSADYFTKNSLKKTDGVTSTSQSKEVWCDSGHSWGYNLMIKCSICFKFGTLIYLVYDLYHTKFYLHSIAIS